MCRLRVPLLQLPGLRQLATRNACTQELRASFDDMDLDKNGTLDKAELAESLKHMGRSQHQVNKLLSRLSDKEVINFQTFTDLVRRTSQRKITQLVWDTELFGYLMCWRVCSAFAPHLQRKISCISLDAKIVVDGDVMFTRNELTARLSDKATIGLFKQAT